MKALYTLLAVVALTLSGREPARAAATIDSMDMGTLGNYGGTVTPGGSLLALGFSETYHLSDGTKWSSGAGQLYSYIFPLATETVQGNAVQYTLRSQPGDLLWQRIDYDGGNHSAVGSLGTAGPLVLTAEIGAKTARLQGLATILSNAPANYTDSRFNYFSAPVGSIVPYDLTYTLTSNDTWQPGIFSRGFDYNLKGAVSFHAVPEASSLQLLLLALLPVGVLAARRRTKAA